MTVGELKQYLSDLPDDNEVRLMMQPNYPLEYSIESVVTSDDIRHAKREAEGEAAATDDGEDVVYITEGDQLGYGSRDAWQ